MILTPTASTVGSIQVTARALETALHKLMYLGFNLDKIKKGIGISPVPPVYAKDNLEMGITNDAIITMGEVVLEVEDEELEDLKGTCRKVPSANSEMFGKPFLEILESVNYDFYKIDPQLFSPAKITIKNIKYGKEFSCGATHWELYQSYLQWYHDKDSEGNM